MNTPQSGPLRLAFLGADAETPALVRAALADGRFRLAAVCEFSHGDDASSPHPAIGAAPNWPSEVWQAVVAQTRMVDSWESLLDGDVCDAVVVARSNDDDARAEQLRKFVQAGVPVLASHPLLESMLLYYELDMIRRESQGVLVPALTLRHHPAIVALAEIVAQDTASPIGRVSQVTIERSVISPTKPRVVAAFARDVDLLRFVAGDLTRLGAMAGAAGDAAYGSLGVQLSGAGGVAARWSVVPNDAAAAEMTLLAAGGKASVELTTPDHPWTLTIVAASETTRRQFEPWDPAAAALDGLVRAIGGQNVQPDWSVAARSVELAETIDRSLLKQRTIELQYEDYSEATNFKGIMASLGCGLLLLGLAVLGVVGLIDALSDQREPTSVRNWPYVLLAVLAVFLLLQLLMLVARRREVPAEPAGRSDGSQG